MATKQITTNILYGRGYTIRQAAVILGRTDTHVGEVVRGRRKSPKLVAKLLALPYRELRFDNEAKDKTVR